MWKLELDGKAYGCGRNGGLSNLKSRQIPTSDANSWKTQLSFSSQGFAPSKNE